MVWIQVVALPRAGVEPGGGAPDLDQHLLGDLLGLGRVAQHPADHAEHRAGDPVVQQLERRRVAARDPVQQVVERAGPASRSGPRRARRGPCAMVPSAAGVVGLIRPSPSGGHGAGSRVLPPVGSARGPVAWSAAVGQVRPSLLLGPAQGAALAAGVSRPGREQHREAGLLSARTTCWSSSMTISTSPVRGAAAQRVQLHHPGRAVVAGGRITSGPGGSPCRSASVG